ncbi:MAG: hypothetical protein EXR83_00570 [Gammaproteobacteria bacterium]|nr:hypothetical protein [Gammaproteobacteria bacterium]
MTAMLASVRSLAEAQVVAACGVPWIDLKEPADGALGAVPLAVVRAVVGQFGATHILSATIGDCWENPAVMPARVAALAATGVAYAKIGLAGQRPTPALLAALALATTGPCGVIAVCFAEAPPTLADLRQLAATGIAGIMLDTARKEGPGLGALLERAQLQGFVRGVAGLGLLCGLAGRLAAAEVPALLGLAPDYLGFRSALCVHAQRVATVEAAQVQALCALFAPAVG